MIQEFSKIYWRLFRIFLGMTLVGSITTLDFKNMAKSSAALIKKGGLTIPHVPTR